MENESQRDPETGLLSRAAFLAEVRKGQSDPFNQIRRGCLLILKFPVLQQIQDAAGEQASALALRNLLGIVESRHRSRDILGRVGNHSLCIFLRRCKEQDAMLIAEQYVALLRDVVLEAGGCRASMDLHYRIVPLDWRGRRSRQGVSKLVKASDDAASVVSAIKTLAGSGSADLGELVHLPPSQHGNDSEPASAASEPVKVAAASYRMRPGILMQHRSLVCCYRVSPLGFLNSNGPLSESPLINAVLDALALGGEQTRPVMESQLIVPVQASQLNSNSTQWLKNACRNRRVAPADVCLSLNVNSISGDMRESLPALRCLNRQGVMLMLEGVSTAAQFSAIRNLAVFDYLLISAKTLQASFLKVEARQELQSLLDRARDQQRQICATGIDTPELLAHAQNLQVDIGFGKHCGRSEPFPNVLKSPV